MQQNSAFDIEKLEDHEQIELAFVHSYNNISICFDIGHIEAELINFVDECCHETLHIYDICSGGQNCDKMRVSFEF